jgi:hypothetical protein
MTAVVEPALRHRVYQLFASTGKAPTLGALAAAEGRAPDAVWSGLRALADAHLLALRPEVAEAGSAATVEAALTPDRPSPIWMAHPFSGVATDFSVRVSGVDFDVNCAWDALSLPSMLEETGVAELGCAESGDRFQLRMGPEGVSGQPAGAVVHFQVPAREFWRDIGFT